MSVIEKNVNKPSQELDPSSGFPGSGGSAAGGASAGLKLLVVGAFFLSFLALVGSGLLYQTLNSERRQREALEGAQDQIREKSALLEKVSESYKAQLEEMQTQFKDYASERDQFKKAIEDNRSLVVSLQQKLKEAEEIKNKALEIKSQAALAPAPAGTSAVPSAQNITPAVGAASQPMVRSPQVLSVNRKFNFVVVSLGVKDGLQIGDPLEIVRQEKAVGTLQVEKLYENFSAATIVRESKEAPIKEGDLVRKLSS